MDTLPAAADPDPATWPSLSVIVPTYNRASLLRKQLAALAQQDYPQWWEVVVADNRSTDDTAKVVRDVAGHLRARLVAASERQSRAHAVNVGAAAAHGEAMVWLDDDDVVNPGYLRAMGAALQRSSFVGARLDVTALNPPWLRGRRRPVQESELPVLLGYRPFVVGAAFGVRSDAFRAAGGCDEDLECLEDVDLSWRLQDAGHRPVLVPGAVLHYRYRHTLADVARQERAYGRWESVLAAKHGLAVSHGRTVAGGGLHIARLLPQVSTLAGQARLATALGATVGRLEGALRRIDR